MKIEDEDSHGIGAVVSLRRLRASLVRLGSHGQPGEARLLVTGERPRGRSRRIGSPWPAQKARRMAISLEILGAPSFRGETRH